MKNKFIFDVDGTLTPSRGSMDTEFRVWFRNFCFDNEVYLVTGSNKSKTVEQLGPSIWALARRVYQCSGNDIWEGDLNVHTSNIEVTEEMKDFFKKWLNMSVYPTKTGNHLEVRPGLINFSVVGRNATKQQRAEYVQYDEETFERETIAKSFNNYFGPNMVAQVAGETGIDIVVKGCDKSQIVRDFNNRDQLHFFGDKIQPGGNDYELALTIANSGGNVYTVNNWRQTWEHLKKL